LKKQHLLKVKKKHLKTKTTPSQGQKENLPTKTTDQGKKNILKHKLNNTSRPKTNLKANKKTR